MATPDARAAGALKIGGETEVVRIGFGGSRITGPGVWGPPENRDEALRVLRRLPELGVNFIDTADAYGPFISEALIAEALHPYDGLVIATKGGLVRESPDRPDWRAVGRPEYLRQCVMMSLRRLKRDQIDLWQLHRIDPHVPRDEQFGVMAQMQKEGLVRHLGLSQVSIEEIQAAQNVFPVAAVQNRYNLSDRSDEPTVRYCEAKGVAFIPWFPLASGDLAKPGGVVDAVSKSRGATPSQVALAWVLKKSPAIAPIPGTSQVAHLEENIAGASLDLTDVEMSLLDDVSLRH